MKSITVYDYKRLRARAVARNAKQGDINNLGEWFERFGWKYWNGSFFDCDNGARLYPVYEPIGEPDEAGDYDDYELVRYEIR